MLRRLAILQWTGLLAGAITWAAEYVVAFGTTTAECSPGGAGFGIANDTWQAALLASSGAIVLGTEVAAAIVYLRTRSAGHDTAPPDGRLHFFAAAGLVANVLFLGVIVLSGIASIAALDCRGG